MINILNSGVVTGFLLNAQNLVVERHLGSYDTHGRWSEDTQQISIRGICYPSTEKELRQVPEGDRITGAVTVLTPIELKISNEEGTSDVIIWNNENYKIAGLLPWKDYGFYAAVTVRMEGN